MSYYFSYSASQSYPYNLSFCFNNLSFILSSDFILIILVGSSLILFCHLSLFLIKFSIDSIMKILKCSKTFPSYYSPFINHFLIFVSRLSLIPVVSSIRLHASATTLPNFYLTDAFVFVWKNCEYCKLECNCLFGEMECLRELIFIDLMNERWATNFNIL